MGCASPAEFSGAYGTGACCGIRCGARRQYLWRSPTLESSSVASFHGALFSQCHKISALARLFVDDTRSGNGRHGLPGEISFSFHQSADCFRACAVLLLWGALASGSSDCDWDELRALRCKLIPADCAALDGKLERTFSGGLRVPAVDGVFGLGCGTAASVSGMSLVCATQTAAA